jgi:hypothetical protein
MEAEDSRKKTQEQHGHFQEWTVAKIGGLSW